MDFSMEDFLMIGKRLTILSYVKEPRNKIYFLLSFKSFHMRLYKMCPIKLIVNFRNLQN